MTQGAFGAIALALALVADAGDEVIIPVPGWFCYDPMLHAANLVPVAAALDATDFSLDIDAIARRHHPAHARGDRELAVEPDRQGLLAGDVG